MINKHVIYYYLLSGVAFTLPFPLRTHASGYAIIALGLGWLFLGDWTNKWRNLKMNPISFLFLANYLLLVLGYFYSEDKAEAKFLLEKNMALFILPLLILSGPRLESHTMVHIGKSFIAGCLIISFYALSRAIYLYFSKGEVHFFYNQLSELAGMHTSYFSMYLGFSILLIGIHSTRNRDSLNGLKIFIRTSICIYFLYVMYLLSSRNASLSLIFIIVLLCLYYFYKKKKLLKGIFIISISAALLIFFLSFLWNTKMRFYYMIYHKGWEWKGKETKNEWLNRKVHWGCYLESIASSNILFGAGSGDSWNRVMPCFKTWDYSGYYLKLNAHNQYLETMLRLGFLGLAVWFASLLIPWWLAFKRKNIYYAIFITLFALCCLTETMLDRQHGVVFYAFFNAIFASFYLWKEKPRDVSKMAA